MRVSNGWWWVELTARLLAPNDRESLLGDLAEAGESTGQALLSVGGLVMRRQLSIWRSWRPWLASLGLAVPATFLLMGLSITVASSYQAVVADAVSRAAGIPIAPAFTQLFINLGLLVAWSWTGGYAVGTISRRTTWISAALSLVASSFCLARFRVDCMSRLCLLLFLPPAIAGLWLGVRSSRIRLGAAVAVALAITVVTIPRWTQPGAWLPNWALSWPAWYLVAIAWRRESPLRSLSHGK